MAKMVEKIETQASGMKSVTQSGDHNIVIDEPPKMGGSDEGPNPLATLLASLAGCENVIANMVAQEINFDLQGIDFSIKGELDSDGMMGRSDVQPYFQSVMVEAEVHTSESAERVKELQETVDARCPVFTALEAANIDMQVEWKKA
ncbi:OsmC family protein [Alkalibacillus sp. S2W]|uniref:OsmC family protein n=1 Tax=Alkalibacillus sp. S2W TaxID=3386553 RepID=UPI00398CDD00